MSNRRHAYKISFGRPEGKILLGRLRRKCEDNIKVVLELIWEGLD
jgi:hypothetical protein